MKNILVCFGGQSPEHEVSIVTGLQALEQLDRTRYFPLVLYITEKGEFRYLAQCQNRATFNPRSGKTVYFGYNAYHNQPYMIVASSQISHPIYVALNAMHGGGGEAGELAGFFASYHIPQTSESVESASVAMNKRLAKQVASSCGLSVVEARSVFSADSLKDDCLAAIAKLGLPLVVKPAHLGSSIGIQLCESQDELILAAMSGLQIDREILLERYRNSIDEYNCSVRSNEGMLQVSEIEKPIRESAFLNFKDKYIHGEKKLAGMANLPRQLPAHIDPALASKITSGASQVYQALGCTGVVRIDWMVSEGELFFNEINPIPGSLASYLWEVAGEPFSEQLTALIEHTKRMYHNRPLLQIERSDIVKRFLH